MKDKEKQIEFKVIDNNTGKEADIGKIAIKEDWAKGLMYCDMQGFAILDDGNLVLLDECGKYEYCPSDRFTVVFEDSVVLSRDNYNRLKRDSDLFEELLKKKVHLETVIELSNAQYEKVVEENKSLERLLSLIDDLPKEQLLDVDKHLEALKQKERKETAEKILNELYCTPKEQVENKIKELARFIGVEIKE